MSPAPTSRRRSSSSRPSSIHPPRRLIVILGDQLNIDASVLKDASPQHDLLWMCEATSEATHVWSSKPRIAVFIAAMRHFAAARADEGWSVCYHALKERKNDLFETLREDVQRIKPESVHVVEPGEWRLRATLLAIKSSLPCPLVMYDDEYFLCSHKQFAQHAQGRKQLRMEFFYREMRRQHDVLLEEDGSPIGGQWNYDAENRQSFDREGPRALGLATPLAFEPDELTRIVLDEISEHFSEHPGSLDHFDWPLTPMQAEAALEDFVRHRGALFGQYQDALWQGEPWLWHSRLSVALNLKLIDPRRVIARVEQAFHAGEMPLAAAEGFIRQVLGWREYVRGIYWHLMPEYLDRNALKADRKLPNFYWTGDTDMLCLQDAIQQTLRYGYAHHIQRLMVTGLFALLLGVDPKAVHGWYLAVYVDAIEWVELPNTLGMSQYADGGVMASKPYVATGRYIERMGNYCSRCRYRPQQSTGERACPFTTLYWDFLLRHQTSLSTNPRMGLQLRNLARLQDAERAAIQEQARQLRVRLGV